MCAEERYQEKAGRETADDGSDGVNGVNGACGSADFLVVPTPCLQCEWKANAHYDRRYEKEESAINERAESSFVVCVHFKETSGAGGGLQGPHTKPRDVEHAGDSQACERSPEGEG